MGADYIEPDLVATRDGHLIARHEPLLDDTTDVKSRPQFASSPHHQMLDGKSVTGFFASDFTLAEIKQLRAVQANPARSKEYDGRFEIPTFEEILDLRERESAQRGRTIGIYPETKHPSFHLDLEPAARRAAARRSAQAQARSARRAGVHPVVREREPAVPAHEDEVAARATARRRRIAVRRGGQACHRREDPAVRRQARRSCRRRVSKTLRSMRMRSGRGNGRSCATSARSSCCRRR